MRVHFIEWRGADLEFFSCLCLGEGLKRFFFRILGKFL